MSDLGKLLIILGIVLAGVGVLLTLVGKVPWLGRLPGDIYYKGDHVTFYFPIVTCLIISVALSLLFYLLRR
ncbi:MAG: DUF2905 domain-containing protein [Reyranellales bacterium]